MTQFKNEEATTDLASFRHSVRQDKVVVKFDHSGWLLILTGNKGSDSTAIAIRVRGEPSRVAVIAAADLHRIAYLQTTHRHLDILAWTRSRAPVCGNVIRTASARLSCLSGSPGVVSWMLG